MKADLVGTVTSAVNGIDRLSSNHLQVQQREPSVSHPRISAQLMRLHSVTGTADFWNVIQRLLREFIPTASMVAYLDYIDHPKTWMATKILTTSNANMPADWFARRWKLDFTPSFLGTHPGIKLFSFSDIITDSHELRNTDYFRHFFKPFDWYYITCLAYWRKNTGLSSVIALRRTREQGDFRPGEIELLKELHNHIDVVLKRLFPAHKEQAKTQMLDEFAQHLPIPLLLLDWDTVPFYANRAAISMCADWNFGPEKARHYDPRKVFRPPPSIIRACEALKEQWMNREYGTMAGTAPHKASSRLSHPELPGYAATIIFQTGTKNLVSRPGFVIYFDRRTPDNRPLTEPAENMSLWRLTTTERDLVRLASEGHSNMEIAHQLHKSVNTVKHQLTSAYSKLGMTGRGNRLTNSIGSGSLATV